MLRKENEIKETLTQYRKSFKGVNQRIKEYYLKELEVPDELNGLLIKIGNIINTLEWVLDEADKI